MTSLERYLERESSMQPVPIIYGAPHAIPIDPEKRQIGNALHKRFGDHFVDVFVRNLRQVSGGTSVILWNASCDPNKSEEFNQRTYGEHDPAFVDAVLRHADERLLTEKFAFMPDAFPNHFGVYVEVHVAGQPNVSRDLHIKHDIEITTGQEKFQDFAHWVASGIDGDVSAAWDDIYFKGAGNGDGARNDVLSRCWELGVPAIMVELSPRIVYPGWDDIERADQLYLISLREKEPAPEALAVIKQLGGFLRGAYTQSLNRDPVSRE